MSSGPWVGISRHLHPSQAPRRGGQGLWALLSDGSQPWACLQWELSLGSVAVRRRTGEEEGHRAAVWSCCRTATLWGTSSTVSLCFPCPLCNSQTALTLLPKTFGGLDGIFFSIAYENSEGGETLKTQVGTVTLRLQNVWNNNFFWQTWTTRTSH